ncbi:probable protein phosphatase 2C 11 [Diachasma alloeum]|uniref:probable protein phosphatase 2C 11 n=1 Tax=Diachasma alloeum TaxID=454923 RepID=UPI0007382D9F|nr:probable protein phosphatase 2C 11 [Diachasma alloeum]
MGAYLSEPITKKISSDESGENVAFGASSMQGWRVSQEDAHNCCISFDPNTSLFAVYDGHGGHEVATYCSQKLPDFIKSTDSYKKGDIPQALIDAFLGFDATLATPATVSTLKKIAGSSLPEKEPTDSCDSSEEDTITNLRKEAEMPLEQVMLKYQTETDKSYRGIASPFLRCRRSKPSCSSGSSAGCSTSSTNESDVSSSSATSADASDTKSLDESGEKKSEPGSSDSDQLLDSTSNGDDSHSAPVIKTDMPDSSEDAADKIDSKISSNSEMNGEDKKISTPDSSKTDNVSSSCNSFGNGDADDVEGISSSSIKAIGEHIYRALLQRTVDDGEESDTDDEEDETFRGGMVEGSDDDEDEEDDDDDEVEDEESEVDDEEDEMDDDDGEFNITEEPGADSGCTAVVALLQGNELYVANAGDSRCVLCRDGEAMELSLDHKPEDQPEMARIVKAGGKVTSDGRVNGGLNLSRALGDHAYKQNSALPPEEQMISALPDIKRVTIDPKRDEFMVLACDGIWNFMSSGDVVKFVRERLKNSGENISKICEELFDHCLAPDTMGDGTGCDNMTAVIVKFKNPSAPETQNNGDTEETRVTKKRPLSTESTEENSEVKNDLPIDECKRAKMEAV